MGWGGTLRFCRFGSLLDRYLDILEDGGMFYITFKRATSVPLHSSPRLTYYPALLAHPREYPDEDTIRFLPSQSIRSTVPRLSPNIPGKPPPRHPATMSRQTSSRRRRHDIKGPVVSDLRVRRYPGCSLSHLRLAIQHPAAKKFIIYSGG